MSETRKAPDLERRTDTVLVVDDDVRVVELLQITLGGRGYQVLSAYDGETALKTIRGHRPDLVVLDVRLPRKSGFEVVEEVRGDPDLRALPIVLISANAATETRLQGLRLGADDYLTKPFSPRELIMKIRRLLDRSADRQLLSLRNDVLEDEVKRHRHALHEMHSEMSWNLNRMGLLLDQVLELNSASSLERVLERFVATTIGGMNFERMALFAETSSGLQPLTSRGVPEALLPGLRLTSDGFCLRVMRSVGRVMRLDEFDSYPEAVPETRRLAAAGLTLLVPAMADHELRGVLALGDRDAEHPLGRFDSKLLEVLGHAIATALRHVEQISETQRSFLETTATLIAAVEERFDYMRGHSERVKDLALHLGRRLVLGSSQMETLRHGALLHDLGQLPVYQDLCDEPRRLTVAEREQNRVQAASRAERLLGPSGDEEVSGILRSQHEWWDGSGFPDGLAGEMIPIGARIVALANAWDALLHERPERSAYDPAEARRILADRSGRQFDPALVALVLRWAESGANQSEPHLLGVREDS